MEWLSHEGGAQAEEEMGTIPVWVTNAVGNAQKVTIVFGRKARRDKRTRALTGLYHEDGISHTHHKAIALGKRPRCGFTFRAILAHQCTASSK
jgi:catalase (peroxidase I)